jgi:GntR family transcriptional regulator / MocR family aminotransferase
VLARPLAPLAIALAEERGDPAPFPVEDRRRVPKAVSAATGGKRIGFLLADGPVHAPLAERKRQLDVPTSNVLQRAVEAYVTVGRSRSHLRRPLCRWRCDATLHALERHLPVLEIVPLRGGLFVWAKLPAGPSCRQPAPSRPGGRCGFRPRNTLLPRAGGREGFLRLDFAAHEPAVLEEGVRRLVRVVRRVG